MASLSLDFLLAIGFRFNPSPQEIVSYYLPLLIAGEQPEDTRDCIHHADVYGADMDVEPGRLAGRFAPVARSTSGDRFFFTACRRVKRRVSRIAGRGTWVAQSTTDVKNEEKVKIGELKTFKFKKERGRDDYSDWLMEEYHCHPGGEEAGDVEPVVCRIYVSPRAPLHSPARRESAAYQPPEHAQPLGPTPVRSAPPRREHLTTQPPPPPPSLLKRAPPVAQPQCSKKMRGAIPLRSAPYQSQPPPPRVLQRPALPPSPSVVVPQRPPCSQQRPPPPLPPPPLPPPSSSMAQARQSQPPPPHVLPRPVLPPSRPPCSPQRELPPPLAASVTGGHHAPRPSPAPPMTTAEHGLVPDNPMDGSDNCSIRLDEFVRFVHDEPEAELLEESLVDAILAPETQEEESSNPMEGFVAPADGDELLKS